MNAATGDFTEGLIVNPQLLSSIVLLLVFVLYGFLIVFWLSRCCSVTQSCPTP